MIRTLGQNGLSVLKHFEGLKTEAYLCTSKVWTIGYGHTQGVKPGMKITELKAEELLKQDISQFEKDVNNLLKVPVSQNQFDALVCFAFNVGSDIDQDLTPEGLGDSTLLKRVNMMDFVGASQEFHKWIRSAGEISNGLIRRRKAESILFMTRDGAKYVIPLD